MGFWDDFRNIFTGGVPRTGSPAGQWGTPPFNRNAGAAGPTYNPQPMPSTAPPLGAIISQMALTGFGGRKGGYGGMAMGEGLARGEQMRAYQQQQEENRRLREYQIESDRELRKQTQKRLEQQDEERKEYYRILQAQREEDAKLRKEVADRQAQAVRVGASKELEDRISRSPAIKAEEVPELVDSIMTQYGIGPEARGTYIREGRNQVARQKRSQFRMIPGAAGQPPQIVREDLVPLDPEGNPPANSSEPMSYAQVARLYEDTQKEPEQKTPTQRQEYVARNLPRLSGLYTPAEMRNYVRTGEWVIKTDAAGEGKAQAKEASEIASWLLQKAEGNYDFAQQYAQKVLADPALAKGEMGQRLKANYGQVMYQLKRIADTSVANMDPKDKKELVARMQKKLSEAQGAVQKQATAQMATPAWAPKVGTVENGYRFIGGDPTKQESWEKVSK